MRPIRITLAVVMAASSGCHTARPDGTAAFAEILAKPEYRQAHWGIHVEDLHTGEVLTSVASDRLFAPASTAKLYSVAAGFEVFGTEHRFGTFLHRMGDVDEDGHLEGLLILRPTGDLTLGGRDDGHDGIAFGRSDHIYANGNPDTELTLPSPTGGLDRLASQVWEAGIRTVDEVLVDARLFAPETSTGTGPKVVTPIVINDNLIDFRIEPTTPGAFARIRCRPQSASYLVDSKIRTTAGGVYTVSVTSPRPGIYFLTGTIPVRSPPQIEVHEVHDPSSNARTLLIEALQRRGIDVRARASQANPGHLLPPRTSALPVVASLRSAPFAESAKLILKVSHNLHASTLPILIALARGGRNLAAGMRLQGDLLKGIGVDVGDVSFAGAAGGARADLTTPRVTTQLLRVVATRPYAAAFRRALPILGVDGTLFQIGQTSPARGKVQAKTGTFYVYDGMNRRQMLTSKALAGYATTPSGRDLAFCLMVNNVGLDGSLTPLQVGQDLGAISTAIQQTF